MSIPSRYKLKTLAKEKGVPVTQIIQEALDEHGTEFKAAVALGVYPGALRWWMKTKPALEGKPAPSREAVTRE